MEKIKDFFNQYNISKQDKIVVACSGGPDSMFLLWTLNKLNFNIICAHVNHNVRSCSKDEYIFLENYCKENQIIFEGMTIKNYSKDNFHNDARSIRYDFFKKIVKKYQAEYLATAHHGDDLIETILMRLNRGSSLSGYSGFKAISKTNDYYLIRPLIKYTKDEILEKVKKQEIPFVIDKSNDSNKYTRNRYRHNILPLLKEENPQVHLKYLSFSEELNEIVEYLKKISENKKSQMFKNNILDITKFKKESPLIQKEILQLIIIDVYNEKTSLITSEHIKNILSIINSSKPNQMINLPNLKVVKQYNNLIFNPQTILSEPYCITLTETITLPNDNILEFLTEDTNDTSNFCIRLDSRELKLPLIVRSKRPGDKIIVKNMTKPKKIKEIFIENKIELDRRSSWPIVTDSDNKIIWIPGLKKSNFDVKKTDKYDIIIKYNLKGEKKSE